MFYEASLLYDSKEMSDSAIFILVDSLLLLSDEVLTKLITSIKSGWLVLMYPS